MKISFSLDIVQVDGDEGPEGKKSTANLCQKD
jgi:hypothetical protein